jgi:hypothetical protein
MASRDRGDQRGDMRGLSRSADRPRRDEGAPWSKDDWVGPGVGHGRLWPSADYQAQVDCLRAAVGEPIYIAELRDSDLQLGVQVTDREYLLLGVIDFPRPDPARGLAPHLILLDDGRGVNLGRIARISRRPFQPTHQEVLYLDRRADQTLLFASRRLSPRFIAERAQAVLGQVLGQATPAPQSPLGRELPTRSSSALPDQGPEAPVTARREAGQTGG